MAAKQERASGQYKRQQGIVAVTCAVLWLLFAWQVTLMQPLEIAERAPAIHFVEYWAAGRLQLSGNNPYSPEQLFALQKSVGLTRELPEIMWNPPWTLFFVMPFGLLSYPTARVLWLVFHFALVLFCVHWCWRFYGGPNRHYWIAWLLGSTFLPSLDALLSEQISALILVGLVGFLHFERCKRWWWAGVFLVLIAVKPHVLYLFWVALILWALDQRRWSLLVAGAMAGLLTTLIPLIFNPAVVGQYLYLYTTAKMRPLDWGTPTLGSLLRLLLGVEKYWLQFLPSTVGLLWFVFHWQQHRQTWLWAEEMPLLLLLSLATTFFGWTYDQVVLLPAVTQAAVWMFHSHRTVAIGLATLSYLAIDSVAITMSILRINPFWYFWLAPALLFTYIALQRKIN